MAFENVNTTLTAAVASADLSSDQFKCITMASGKAALVGAGLEVDGVLQNKPAALDRPATVAIAPSVTKVITGAAVAVGALVASDAAGLAVLATTGQFAFGRALEASAGANEVIAVQLMPFGDAP